MPPLTIEGLLIGFAPSIPESFFQERKRAVEFRKGSKRALFRLIIHIEVPTAFYELHLRGKKVFQLFKWVLGNDGY